MESLDGIMLLGAVPAAEAVPRFFDESTHHAMQQSFLSLWERRGDEYVRTAGQVVESPMRALTEFMAALSAGKPEEAARRATGQQAVADALALGWDDLDGTGLMVSWSGWRPAADEQCLGMGARDSWSPVYEPPRQARLVWREGRWLVAEVWEVPLDTPWPTTTPEPVATRASDAAPSPSG